MQKETLNLYLIMSAIGGLLILMLLILAPRGVESVSSTEKMLLCAVLILINILGITLAFRPNWPSQMFKNNLKNDKSIAPNLKDQRVTSRNFQKSRPRITRFGHHPDCGRFSGHVLMLNNKRYCAGCIGLALGAAISIALTLLYLLIPVELNGVIWYYFLFFGIFFMLINFIKWKIPNKNPHLNMTFNVILVLSFFLIVIGLFQISGKLIYGLIGVVIAVLWLDTRIQVSNWNHEYICRKCAKLCKEYLYR
jgi:hypothetical protein